MKKYKLSKRFPYLFCCIILVSFFFINCSSKDSNISNTTLTINNKLTSTSIKKSQIITNIKLTGYEFNNLNIGPGSSQTFSLDDGLPVGFNNVKVQIELSCYSSPSGIVAKSYDFSKGSNTIINILNCPQVNNGDCGNIVCIE